MEYIMDANRARSITNEQINMQQNIDEKIKEACHKGKGCLFINKSEINSQIEQILKNKRYKVEVSRPNSDNIKITWLEYTFLDIDDSGEL